MTDTLRARAERWKSDPEFMLHELSDWMGDVWAVKENNFRDPERSTGESKDAYWQRCKEFRFQSCQRARQNAGQLAIATRLLELFGGTAAVGVTTLVQFTSESHHNSFPNLLAMQAKIELEAFRSFIRADIPPEELEAERALIDAGLDIRTVSTKQAREVIGKNQKVSNAILRRIRARKGI